MGSLFILMKNISVISMNSTDVEIGSGGLVFNVSKQDAPYYPYQIAEDLELIVTNIADTNDSATILIGFEITLTKAYAAPSNCTTNWTAYNTSCTEEESYILYYIVIDTTSKIFKRFFRIQIEIEFGI